MDRHRAIAAALALACAGCNSVFGIEATRVIDSDGDGDGVADSEDNCLLVATSDQNDTDGDGLGDACDPCVDGPQTGIDTDGDGEDDLCDVCPAGANSDEDGDAVPDGCDVCPADADDQADDDGDGIGNSCDAEPGVTNRRLMFDGFSLPRAGWHTWFNAWAQADGAFAPVQGGDVTGAWNLDGLVTGSDWWFEAEAVTPAESDPTSYDTFGMTIRTMPGGSQQAECLLEWNFGKWDANYDTSTVVLPGSTVRFRFHASSSGAVCTIDRVAVPTLSVFPGGHVAALGAGLGTRFLWIDVVAGPE